MLSSLPLFSFCGCNNFLNFSVDTNFFFFSSICGFIIALSLEGLPFVYLDFLLLTAVFPYKSEDFFTHSYFLKRTMMNIPAAGGVFQLLC